MDDCPESLEAPYVFVSENKEKWIIFPNSNPDPFKHPKACIDSMLSTCVHDNTLKECIEVCESDKRCEFGYYVKGKNSVCLPLYTSDYYPEANPLLSIKNKKCFPKTKADGIKTDTFIRSTSSDWLNMEGVEDKKSRSWPLLGRSGANAVFMGDKLLISIEINGKVKHIKIKGQGLILDDEGTEFQIFDKYGISRDILADKVNFYNNVSFILGNKKSAIILEADSGYVLPKNHYNWAQDQLSQTFQILPISTSELGGEEPMKAVVSYGDKFFLTRSGGFIGENSQELFNILYADTDGIKIFDDQHRPREKQQKNILVRNLSQLSENTPDRAKFFFTPTKTVYYCESKETNSCKPVKLIDATKRDKQSAYYNNKPLFLREDCFGSCAWSNKQPVVTDKLKDPSTLKGVDWNAWVLIFGAVVLIAIIILITT